MDNRQPKRSGVHAVEDPNPSQIQVGNQDFVRLVAQLLGECIKFDAERFDGNSWIIKLRP